MGNSLRNLLLIATIGLSMPGAMAQSESFTGLSGNSYHVDYASGLVMQLHENEATIVSPQKVVESEFDPVWDQIIYLATQHDITNEALKIDKETFLAWTNVWDLQNQTYVLATSNFTEAAYQAVQQYSNLFDIIERIIELGRTAKPAKVNTPETRNATSFSFNISGTIADYKYAEFLVGFTREYLEDFEKEIEEFGEELQESSEELDEIILDYDNIINYHFAYIEGLCEWLDQYAEIADEDLLYEIAQDIVERIEDLAFEVENLPSNPAEYLTTWAEICLDYMNSTEENFMEAYAELIKVTEEITLLRRDFSGVIFAGPAGDEVGLYYTILKDNGSLILPPFVNIDGKEYYVTGIDGNIFSGMPEGMSMTDLKLVLPATIMSISNEAFPIDGIKEVTAYSNSVPLLDSNCFTEATYNNAQLFVRDNLVEDYRITSPWNKFQNILPESMSSVNGIEDLKPEVRIEGSKLIVNAPDGNIINVYTADGRTVYIGYFGNIELPAKGLYIVRTANRSIKIRY